MAEQKLSALLEILNYSSELMKTKGIRDARLNVEMMLADVLNCSRLNLYLDFEKPLSSAEISEFKTCLKRRLNHEPLQYILGSTEFYGYPINLNDGVFIPRPDTEILVEKTIESIKSCKKNLIKIIEIGTGSGCITTALACELTKSGRNFDITSIDINQKALDIARENLNNNLSNIVPCTRNMPGTNFTPGSIATPGSSSISNTTASITTNVKFLKLDFLIDTIDFSDFDFIVSNPPYIPLAQIASLDPEIRDYEPLEALTDNKDGLEFLKRLFNIVKADGKTTVLFETAFDQRDAVIEILKKNEIIDFEYFKDYGNNWRVIKFKL